MKGFRDSRAVLDDCAKNLGVFVRPAQLSDACQLIELNKHFRYEMAQWEAGVSGSGECNGYPILDFDDVQYILEEEDPKNLMVIGRRLEGEERFVGYSYSYAEPWKSSTDGPVAHPLGIMSPRPKRGKGSRTGEANKEEASEANSLYIAELFISDSERGLGLGELLLADTLEIHMGESTRSHLFVSSKNVGAVRCYLKFGYEKGSKPSGDQAHDLVMELASSNANLVLASNRFQKALTDGTLGARKRRPTPNGSSAGRNSTRHGGASPPQLSGVKASVVPVNSESPNQDSRASSRATVRGSPQQEVVTHCPRPTRGRLAILSSEEDGSTQRKISKTDRNALERLLPTNSPHSPVCQMKATERCCSRKRSPLMSSADSAIYDEGVHQLPNIIRGRQRKNLQLDGVRNASKELRSGNAKQKGAKIKSTATVVHENDANAYNVARRSQGKGRFMITLFTDGKRREAEDRIKALGGEIVSSEYYEPRCTHVISARPATTEKYLCAVAAGKHVLHPSYIEDSFQQGSFLPVEEYEWCAAVDGMESIDDYGLALAKAPEMWKGRKISARIGRKSVAPLAEEKKSCFDGMVCVVLSSAEKRAGFKRILEAGGAVVCGDLEDRFKTLRKNSSVQDLLTQEARERNRRVTHVFINKEIYEMQYKDWPGHEIREIFPILEDLYDQGAKFLFEDYVVEKIAQNIDLRSKASKVYHVDVDSWMKQNRVPEAKVGNKRKSVHQST